MEAKVNFNVLEAIEKVYKHSQDSLLRAPLFEVLEKELSQLSAYLHLDQLSVVIFANAFAISLKEDNFSEVFKHFGMNEFLDVLKHRENIELLYERKLLVNTRGRYRQINSFEISQGIVNKISKGEPMPLHEKDHEREKTFVDVLQDFDELSGQFDDERIDFYDFRAEINQLVKNNLHFPFFTKMQAWKLSDFETFFLLDTIWDAIENGGNNYNTSVSVTVNDYHKEKGIAMEIINSLINGETKLTYHKLIEIEKSKFKNNANAKLSRQTVKLLKETQNLQIEYLDDDNTKLLNHKKFPLKPLFYNPEEADQMEVLSEILTERKFREMQKKLRQKAMPSGIAVLLHGAPGTGKTESVYQLAKKTGRNVFKVDISTTKSMWFGESQKLAKRIFTDYSDFCKEEKRTPILLFNEADAIIGKRKSAGSSNVADTENAIQNVILEEMENFDGIMFATTNLVENMDAAFERRFLFKVKFDRPEPGISAKIWQLKLPFLSENEALQLAGQFDFSGGEMENIARKILMDELVNGENPCFEKVLELCRNEKWAEKGGKRIGF